LKRGSKKNAVATPFSSVQKKGGKKKGDSLLVIEFLLCLK